MKNASFVLVRGWILTCILLLPAIDEWRKRRESGQISDLENQYGDPEKIGGIPLPMASFGGERIYEVNSAMFLG